MDNWKGNGRRRGWCKWERGMDRMGDDIDWNGMKGKGKGDGNRGEWLGEWGKGDWGKGG